MHLGHRLLELRERDPPLAKQQLTQSIIRFVAGREHDPTVPKVDGLVCVLVLEVNQAGLARAAQGPKQVGQCQAFEPACLQPDGETAVLRRVHSRRPLSRQPPGRGDPAPTQLKLVPGKKASSFGYRGSKSVFLGARGRSRGLLDEHHGDPVANRVDASTPAAFQASLLVQLANRALARRANQDFE